MLAPMFLARGIRLWVLVRVTVAVVLLTGKGAGRGGPFDVTSLTVMLIVGLTMALGVVDVRRRGERAFLGNFGVSGAQLLLWLTAPAVIGETAVSLVLSALR